VISIKIKKNLSNVLPDLSLIIQTFGIQEIYEDVIIYRDVNG
jgi:hypothetical protein